MRSRNSVAARIKTHISKPDATPLLIFPEGTFVNNEFSIMFKKGAFEIGAMVSYYIEVFSPLLFHTIVCLNNRLNQCQANL